MAAGSNNIVTDGLVCCWDGGNRRCGTPSAGGTWTGLGVNAPATLVNSAEFEDISLGAIAFDGTDDKVTVANTTDIDGAGGFTFDIWLYFLAVPTDNYTIFSLYNGDGGSLHEFMLYIMEVSEYSKSVMVGSRGGSNAALRNDNAVMSPSNNIGKWVHYCATYNGDGENTPTNYKIYFNGQDMGSDGNSQFGAGLNGNVWGIDGSSGDLNGYIGRVAFYNKELTAAQILQNHEATKPRFEPRITKEGLMGYWDAGDPLCYDGNLVNYYAASTYNLKDLSSGNIGQFANGNPLPNFSLDNGGYWTFDGTDDGIWAGKGSDDSMYNVYSNANGITGIMWMNLASDGLNVFFWKDHVFQFRYDSTSKLNMRTGNASSWSTSTDLQSAADLLTTDGSEWACVVASANKSNDAREIWLNGERVANDTGSGMVWGTDNETMGVAGGWDSDTLHGKVGMALLYSRALSAAEIKDFYNKTKARFGH